MGPIRQAVTHFGIPMMRCRMEKSERKQAIAAVPRSDEFGPCADATDPADPKVAD